MRPHADNNLYCLYTPELIKHTEVENYTMWTAVAKSLVSAKPIGIPAARILQWIGQDHYRTRVLEFCGYLPRIVPVKFPAHLRQCGTFHLSSGDGTDQIAWALWTQGWNGFERPMLDLFAAAARSSQTIIDVGANSGLYAVLAARAAREATVHAFEPLPQAISVLRNNVKLNGVNDRVSIVEAAVSDESGRAKLFVPAGNAGVLEMSASLSSEFRAQHSQVLCVAVTTLDEFVRASGIEKVDLLKVDVESQEHRVLTGARHVIAAHRPLILLEVLAGADVNSLEAIRKRHDYLAFRLRPFGLVRAETVDVDRACQNQLLAPSEAMPRLKKIAELANLRLVLPSRAAVADRVVAPA